MVCFFFYFYIFFNIFTINNAYNARFNEFDKNTNLLLNYSLIKFALIYLHTNTILKLYIFNFFYF